MKLTNSFMVSANIISNTSTNPAMVLEAMKRTMSSSMKLLKGRYVFDLFTKLCNKKVGTNAMVNQCKRICSGLPRGREQSMLEIVMKWRLQDAKASMFESERENTRIWRDSKRIITAHRVREEYETIWRREKEKYQWHLRGLLRSKVSLLVRRYTRKTDIPDSVRGIVVKDQQIPADFSNSPRCYGGVELNEDERAALSLPPKYAIHSKINTTDCEAQVEKGLAKLRWSIQKRGREEQDEEPSESISFKPSANVFDFRFMRATDLPFNQRVKLPDRVQDATEIKMCNLKQELKKITAVVQSEIVNGSNLTEMQQRGVASLSDRVKSNDIVVFQTDKSGRFSVDTPDNYRQAVQPHIDGDPEISSADRKKIENHLNAHGISWTRILSAGKFTHNESRIKDNMLSSNGAVPPLYGLRKDHKMHQDPIAGPPTRPVCGANTSVNYRMSYLMSLVLSEIWQRDRTGCVCMNTEEMMAEIARVNADGLDDKIIIGSTDVKALYPSLDIEFTIQVVCGVFRNSNISIHGVDYEELGLYISLNRSSDEIQALGLDTVCPARARRRGAIPTITSSGTAAKKEDRFRPWQRAVSFPDDRQRRVMFTEAIRIGLEIVMKNHVYEFDGRILHQQNGGPIGLELTGNIAQVFMLWWDRTLISRLSDLGIVARLCKRYVDDVNFATIELPVGTRYANGKLYVDEEAVEGDMLISGDKRTMEVVKSIGNGLHPSIQLEVDCPSNHEDGKMPILDLKVWVGKIDGETRIIHEFYAKEVSSKAVINARSALSWQQKRTVLTQEVLRVLLSCSSDIPWEQVARHASTMALRMQFSGYSKKFRHEVVDSAVKAYDDIRRKVTSGERPLYRPFEWEREERDQVKQNKVLNWYKKGGYESIIFVPSTPGSELQRRYQEEIDRHGLRIRTVEKAGRSLKSMLQRSNPFKKATCGRESCLICETGGRGSCSKDGINYDITCVGCEDEGQAKAYVGESSKNGFTRGKKHLQELDGKTTSSVMWRHCREYHGSDIQDFRMSVTGNYSNDAMLRQISEAVRINNIGQERLINNKTEWNFVTFPRVMVDSGDAA